MIIGTGSTTFELANLLCMKSGFKIFTDSLPVASVLIESDNQVFSLAANCEEEFLSVWGVGGIYDQRYTC